MRSFAQSCFALLAAVLVTSGCSDDDSASPAGDFIREYCTLMMPCCTEAGASGDASQCMQILGYGASTSIYNPAQGEQCLTEMRAASQNGTVCPMQPASSAACDQAFSSTEPGGSAQPGQVCEMDDDCARPAQGEAKCLSSHDVQTGATTRTCVTVLPGEAGSSPCVGTRDGSVTMYSSSSSPQPLTGYVCDKGAGLTCDGQSHSCEALGAPGAECSNDSDCLDSAWCNWTTQQCVARVAAGSSCDASSSQCDVSSYCDDTQVCVSFLAPGAACTQSKECKSHQCENGKCKVSLDLGLAFICKS